MNFKKKVSGSWVDAPYYLKGTDTETITTLPATIYPLAQTATISMKGQTVQNGTPTPDNPIPVIGVGDDNNGQYKIPISSANTITPVYLGEVQSTRRIKKLVLTGEEEWIMASNNTFRLGASALAIASKITSKCSHYQAIANRAALVDMINRCVCMNSVNGELWIRDTDYGSSTDFNTYLATQYAAGTPVCVWYVLATEETAVVNEPLMRIGEYADTLSNVPIPVTAGGDTLSVGTTVQPSEVSVNYQGWHPVADVHERDNGAWI